MKLTNALLISLPLWFNKNPSTPAFYAIFAIGMAELRTKAIVGAVTSHTVWLKWVTWYIQYGSLIWNASLDRFGLCESVRTRAYNSDWINFRFNGAHILNKCILHKNRFHKKWHDRKRFKRETRIQSEFGFSYGEVVLGS